MDNVFPFDLPWPTAFYEIFYVLTLGIHVVFMNYVLAGTIVLLVGYLRPTDRGKGASCTILKEWLPFMLSGAITAGVAPLLFLQILYKQNYYTANLLLFNRWMAILPVLIVGFYSMYLLKSRWLANRSWKLAALVASIPVLTIAFTGYSWTENHLLSIRTPAYWGEFYASKSQLYTDSQLLPRLLIWGVGAFPTMFLVLGWQHWYRSSGTAEKLARRALASLFLVACAAAWYYMKTDEATRMAFVSPLAKLYFGLSVAGTVLQLAGWFWISNCKQLRISNLSLVTAGLTLTIVGMTVCREAIRMHALGSATLEKLYPLHREAYEKGGLFIFLFFFAVNAGLIGLVFWLVKHRSVGETQAPTAH